MSIFNSEHPAECLKALLKERASQIQPTDTTALETLCAMLPQKEGAWLSTRLRLFRRTSYNDATANDSADLALAILDLTDKTPLIQQESLDLAIKIATASRVASAALDDPAEVVVLHLWVVAPQSSSSCPVWINLRQQIRRDDRSCPKDIWLVGPDPETWEEEFDCFLQEGPLASPWALDRGDGNVKNIDFGADLYAGEVTRSLCDKQVSQLDRLLRSIHEPNIDPGEALQQLIQAISVSD